MIKQQITLSNPSGLHARPASLFVEALKKYSCKTEVTCNGKTKNGKSLIGLLSLCIKKGQTFELLLDGDDEAAALAEVNALVAANFYEGE